MRPSDDAVRAATGRSWTDWFVALDAVAAADWDHKAIVQHLEVAHPELQTRRSAVCGCSARRPTHSALNVAR